MYETKTVQATATDGTKVDMVVPTEIPTLERAEYLRKLYTEYVEHPDGHWKGRAIARCVPAELADDVAEAMDFVGSIVDWRSLDYAGTVTLFSRGYWAHGF
jgi:hypothetical protein